MLRKNLLFLFVLLQMNAFAQSPALKLEKAFEELSADPQAKHALLSLCVLDATTGNTLFARNENLGIATASTLKTITAATAFNLLGKDFKFETTLAYSGAIVNGVLKGNILIIGGGDPTLGSPRYPQSKENYVLSQWVQALKSAGITRIEGSVIGDDMVWGSESIPEGWIWQDIGNYYGAAPSVLSWRENQFDIHLKSAAGRVNLIKAVPEMPYLKIVNELKVGAEGSGDQAYAFLPPLGQTAYLRGSWALGISKAGISAAMPDPAFDLAYRLQDTLKRLGIVSSAEPSTTRRLVAEQKSLPVVTQKLMTLTSPPLSDIIYWFQKKSINLYGENLVRTFAWKAGKEATTKNGVATALNYWAGQGLEKSAMNMIDGSGLSPATRVTTAAMSRILFLAQSASWYPEYLRSFPENNGMLLKSGTISDVLAYAGYHTAGTGKKYIIVININNYSGSGIKNKLFKVLDALK